MYLRNYKIVQTHTKGCPAKMHGDVTGDYVLPHASLAPTESPSMSHVSKSTTPTGCAFADDDSLKTAVKLWTSNEPQAIADYGEIKHWNTRKFTHMRYLFNGKGSFNEDSSLWDVSKVTDILGMFFIIEHSTSTLVSGN